MKADNPFTLTFGKQPNEYIARYENTEEIRSTFTAPKPVAQTFLIQGVRGSGKTVLMTSVGKELAEDKDWLIVDLNSSNDLLTDFASRLTHSIDRTPSVMQSGFNLSLAGFGIGVGGKTPSGDSVSIIQTALEFCKKKGKRVLVTIDEASSGDNMRRFASQFQIFLRQEYPVFLLMTGLYEQIYSIQNDPQLTFLLRSPKIQLPPLSLYQIREQYRQIFRTDEKTAEKLAKTTKGYAFAFQALGMLYYEYGEEESWGRILAQLDSLLDDFVYRKIWEGLSPMEKRIVLAMPDHRIRIQELRDKLQMDSSTFSVYRDRLIKSGLLIAPQYGYAALALPRFDKVIALYDATDE